MRCAAHGLATGPDGRCVVCRRESTGTTEAVRGSLRAAPGVPSSGPRTGAVPIGELVPGSGARRGRGLTLLVGLCWLAASGAAALWVWQQELAAPPGSVASVPRPLAPALAAGPEPEPEVRALTEAEAMRQVELAADRSLQTQLEDQRARKAELDLARQRAQAAEAERDVQRKAEIEADIERQVQGAAQRGVEVVMYTTSWCGACKHARAYLREHGFRYDERDIETNPQWREQCRVLNPRLSVPTIRIGNRMMVGFRAETFERHFEQAAQERAQGRQGR